MVSALDQRVTADILDASLLVLAVPRVVRSKAIWSFLDIATPEMLMFVAVAQWNAAKISTTAMGGLGLEDWSMVQYGDPFASIGSHTDPRPRAPSQAGPSCSRRDLNLSSGVVLACCYSSP
ncbi:hypothetical protein HD806DRAFT_550711 [Xylariaceae sp. AK1471]|nr:hypothetical protein HD806DRAFT_550711 [Xylariaceae sp. AK1471]